RRRGDGRAEPTLDPVALSRMADPLGNGQADPKARIRAAGLRRRAPARLDRHPLRMKAAARGRRDEVGSFGQTPDGHMCARVAHRVSFKAAYAERRLRPWARRAAMTLRPPLVAMRARK